MPRRSGRLSGTVCDSLAGAQTVLAPSNIVWVCPAGAPPFLETGTVAHCLEVSCRCLVGP
ncbi:hypothetical protein DPMN_138839 [Dreissena polymorpha]|uniref:Uncharacterized protein n=1 Tax=Dreissena polymorpha TaxID=45954 RepID=A0A9D4G583_DREPO|nr:hypothetical protein DPMN_138839 [Dreissena polymorpha]